MHLTLRVGRSALLALTVLVPLGALPAATASEPDARWTTATGTLLAFADGDPGYALATDDGLVPVVDPIGVDGLAAAVNDQVTAELRVPAALDALPGAALSPAALRDWTQPQEAVVVAREEVAAPATGAVEHDVYVARPTNVGASALSDAQVLAEVGAATDYWLEEANGAISGFDLPSGPSDSGQFGTYATSVPDDDVCEIVNPTAMTDEAADLFPQGDFVGPDATDLLVIVTPEIGCDPSVLGQGMLGQSFASGGTSIVLGHPDYLRETTAHELGHNFGLGHANVQNFGRGWAEYANVYSIMGYAIPGSDQLTALGTAYRVGTGITDAGEIDEVTIPDPGQSVTVTRTLKPRTDETGLRALEVSPPGADETYYVEYRAGVGKDAGSAYAADKQVAGYQFRRGVVVEVVNDDWSGVSGNLVPDVLDSRVATVAGETWHSPDGAVMVAVTSMASTQAQVTLTHSPVQPFTTKGTASLTGSGRVGEHLTVSLAGWSPEPQGISVTWDIDFRTVQGEHGPSLLLQPDAVGKVVSGWVTVTAPGRAPVLVYPGMRKVEPGVLTFSAGPSLSDSMPVVGEPVHATWSAAILSTPTPTFQWFANGVAIPGATGARLVPTAADIGKVLTATVGLTAPGYLSASRSTAQSAPVVAEASATPPPTLATLSGPRPTISGKAKAGKKLTAKTGTWPAGTTFSYRWLADGKKVKKGTKPTLRVTKAMIGKRLKVKVTAAKTGYTSVTKASARTKRVSG